MVTGIHYIIPLMVVDLELDKVLMDIGVLI